MKILQDIKLYSTKWITLWTRKYTHRDHESEYFVASRNSESLAPYPPEKPSAVIIATVYKDPMFSKNLLLLTSEFRVPVGGRELSFPAGLVDTKDLEGKTTREAAISAATRELFEETGLKLTKIIDVSPILFSSAGFTDESVVIVTCEAQGHLCTEKQEQNEDILFRPLTQSEAVSLLEGKFNVCSEPVTEPISKVCYPYLKMFAKYGEIF